MTPLVTRRARPPWVVLMATLLVVAGGTARAQQPPPDGGGGSGADAAQPPEQPGSDGAGASDGGGGAPASEPKPGEEDPAARKESAKRLFEQGVALQHQGELEAALAAFVRSRALYATRNATYNAAVCLTRLDRLPEALVTYETLLREFPGLPPDDKRTAQTEIERLRGLVGAIDVQGAPVGAQIAVDGRTVGEAPLLGPVRVRAGTHVVRVYAEGFAPFEAQSDVAGGDTATVRAKLTALLESGELSVREAAGGTLDVLLDGVTVGQTPWSGRVSVGRHVVALRGEGALGTEPAAVEVAARSTVPLSLAAEPLGGVCSVRVAPPGTSIHLDGVEIARGAWEGRLRRGAHRIGAMAPGFLPADKEVELGDDPLAVALELEPDPDADLWREPSHVVLDASVSLALAPAFAGDVSDGCGEGCDRSVPLGLTALGYVGYELPSGWLFGAWGGYVRLEQAFAARSVILEPRGLPPLAGSADETLRLSGGVLGAMAGLHLAGEPTWLVRVAVGAGYAQVGDLREAVIADGATSFAAPDLVSSTAAWFVAIAPEARVGYDLGSGVELGASLAALLLVPVGPPRWGEDGDRTVVAPTSGYATYPDETLLGPVVVAITPGVGLRYALPVK